ncbi:hypothetical protein SAMN06295912_1405 [Sphingomonas laterariae]|uniref:Uncharacterized protein n=1 Tax=Edaphosphingomonas laterariae TaxID=861865 RepID=A0A239JVG8_9SPHN|nr:hypothetical protein [Sphingomonas laterariae]SNT09542.1 hypothetical protein SAMN06295912_1405 [Sphingomonas laterariae]
MTPAEIAAKLTGAQRSMVLASGPDDISGREGLGVDIVGSRYRSARALEALGIGHHTHGSEIADMYWNSAAGLAVREHLMKEGA